MLRKVLIAALVLVVVAVVALWFLSAPRTLAASDLPPHTPDLANGAYVFYAGGCESCHAAVGAKGEEQLKLGGGRPLTTPFGTFHVPNISPDPEHGIGTWTDLDFVNAMKLGVGPGGVHLYPAFPYTSYQRMTIEDLIDLRAYLATLPPVAASAPPHDLSFPVDIRRGLGLWKLLYVDGQTFVPDPTASAEVNRGAYLVEGAAHCGECHTPRNFFGGLIASRAFSGGPSPVGRGTIPNITPDEQTGIGDWSHADIVQLLETGFTPEFDSVGGDMAAVQQNMAKLTPEDRSAIAAYLKTLTPINSPRPRRSAAPSG